MSKLKIYLVMTLFFVVLIHIFGLAETLDKRFFYSQEEAVQFFDHLQAGQVKTYFLTELFDLGLIISYGMSLFYLSQKPIFKKFKFCFLFPPIFDLLETTTILFLLTTNHFAVPIWLGSMTFLKWFSGFILFGLMAFSWLRNKIKSQSP